MRDAEHINRLFTPVCTHSQISTCGCQSQAHACSVLQLFYNMCPSGFNSPSGLDRRLSRHDSILCISLSLELKYVWNSLSLAHSVNGHFNQWRQYLEELRFHSKLLRTETRGRRTAVGPQASATCRLYDDRTPLYRWCSRFCLPCLPVVDTNDRFLRKITVGQASTEKGQMREVCSCAS